MIPTIAHTHPWIPGPDVRAFLDDLGGGPP
jgi:hypothetical protein